MLYCIYAYNVQPGVNINYATGNSSLGSDMMPVDNTHSDNTYILNTNSKKFHLPSCSSAPDISEKYREGYTRSRENGDVVNDIPVYFCLAYV